MDIKIKRRQNWRFFWHENAPNWTKEERILHLITASNYAAEQLQKNPHYHEIIAQNVNWQRYDFNYAWQRQNIPNDEESFLQLIRTFKHRHQVAMLYALLNGQITQTTFSASITNLACTLLNAAHNFVFEAMCKRYSTPSDERGTMPMIILGMGKLGGGELNFSSDIDLIFSFRRNGQTTGENSIEYNDFFRKLAQKIIFLLDVQTVDGFVYRVDTRLRPFGQSGPLVLSCDASEQYYLVHGRDWERYAMMKARAVAGDIAGGEELLTRLRPFIYRKYLDYQVLGSIVKLKRSINKQIQQQGMERHIKLGKGGIREAEFCVQAMQMVYGGQYAQLQNTNFITALYDLAELNLWNEENVQLLADAYILLRSVEDALQFENEQQVHQLPLEENEEQWQRLACACSFSDVEELQQQLQKTRDTVHNAFQDVFSNEDSKNDDEISVVDWSQPDSSELERWFNSKDISIELQQRFWQRLKNFANNVPWRRLPQKTIDRINQLIPNLLYETVAKKDEGAGFCGLLNLVEAVSGRSVYIDMLAEQRSLLSHLLDIAASSSWLMDFICEHPLVLDDILSQRTQVSDARALLKDLHARLQGIDDDEHWLHALRDFKHAQVFKVAWEDIHDHIALMNVSDHLSYIAELVLHQAYNRAYQVLQSRYGKPRDNDGNEARFAIIAYGKLGGLELAYGSDLDLLYLYDDNASQGKSDGKNSIDNVAFFTRLVRRLQNYLTAPSTSGVLYKIDTRLRPGGLSSLVVTSLQSFIEYQRDRAWTWEHQALSRARFLCGDMKLGATFEQLRLEILQKQRSNNLKTDVLRMRDKIQELHRDIQKGFFDLKNSPGGLIDIEFCVQYLLLQHAHREPVIARMSDNIRQLAALEATGIISSSMAMELRDAYRKMREEAHHCYLNGQDCIVAEEKCQAQRQKVLRIKDKLFATDEE